MSENEKPSARTSRLLRELFRSSSIKGFLENNSDELEIPKFHEYISSLCKTSGLIPEQVIKQAAIERTYGHQLFNGTRKPSRDKVIQLAFGFKLNVEETQKLLQIGQKSLLYPKIKRDAAVLYCINHQKDIYDMQSVLEILDLPLLGGE